MTAPIEYVPINGHADDVGCVCGNDVMGEGFYSADRLGLISPNEGGRWDGSTIACLACGRLIDTDPGRRQPNPGDTWRPFRAPVTGRIPVPTGLPDD